MTIRMARACLALAGTGLPACEPAPASEACGQESGVICTWAGTGARAFDGDGRPRIETSLYWPLDLEFAPDGRAYVLDWQNHRVRRVQGNGRFETIIGSDYVGDGPPDQGDLRPEGAQGTTVELNHPTDIAFHPDGALVLAAWHNHKIRRCDPETGLVHVLAGSGPGGSGDGGPATRALFNQPKAVAVDAGGNIYVTDSRNQRVRRIDAATSIVETVAGSGQVGFGGDGGAPLAATFHMQQVNENPEPGGGIALDAQGRLYLADTYNHRIRRIDLGAGTVDSIVGSGAQGFSGDGGPATAAALNRPRDLEIGPDGRLYVADTDNHRVRVVDLAAGTITTVAGNGKRGFSGDGGAAVDAELDRPFGIGFDGAGHLYVADTFNGRIRRVAR